MRSFSPLFGTSLLLAATSICGCATVGGPGHLDARMVQSATADTAKEVELDLTAAGAVVKIAVEHRGSALAPPALRALVEKTWPGATLTEYEEELYADGGRVHEVEVKTADGKECELSMSEAGALRYTECQLKAAEAPPEIQKAITAATPNGEVKEIERRQGPGCDEFRVELKQGERTFYLRIQPDGKLLSRAVRLEAELTIPLGTFF